MPELPEVEIMTRNVRRWSQGKELVQLEGGEFSADLWKGKTFGQAYRRGKFLVWPLGDLFFVLHFRMTGKIVIESQPRKHTRFRWVLGDGTALVFIDQRRFGSVELLSNIGCQNRFQKLGAEPWPAYRDGAWYRRRWGKSKGSIKSTMLKQEHVAGIGNIMASEICFRMGIDPRISCERLNERDWEALGVELHRFVESVLEEESSPEIAFVSQGGALPKAFLVYGRNGQSCRCGTIIQVMKQGGRSTYWCPRCQVSR